jgi:hypothetical protein
MTEGKIENIIKALIQTTIALVTHWGDIVDAANIPPANMMILQDG